MGTDPTEGVAWMPLEVDGERYDWRCAVGLVEVRALGAIEGTMSQRLVVEARKPPGDAVCGAVYAPETVPGEALAAELIRLRGPRTFRKDDLQFGIERRDDGVYVLVAGRRRGSVIAQLPTLAPAQRLVRLLQSSETVPIADANAPKKPDRTVWAEAAPDAFSVREVRDGVFDVLFQHGGRPRVVAVMKSAREAEAVVACLSSAVRVRVTSE